MPAMSSSELSLRHLPNLSDASFSFQIPVDSGDDLLRADSNDFFGGGASLLGSPSSLRANDAPLTLSDLTPLASVISTPPFPKSPPRSTKSLLPTTRSNIQDLTGSQIASRVPKPVFATHRKPRQTVVDTPAPRAEIPAETEPLFPGTAVAPPAEAEEVSDEDSPSVNDSGALSTDDFSFQFQATSSVPSIPLNDVAEPVVAPVDKPPVVEKSEAPTHPVASSTEVTAKLRQKSKKVSSNFVYLNHLRLAIIFPQPVSSTGLVKAKVGVAANVRPKPVAAPTKTREASKNRRPTTNAAAQTHVEGQASSANDLDNNMGMGIATRLLMYGEQMISSFPQSDNEDAGPKHQGAAPMEDDNAQTGPGGEIVVPGEKISPSSPSHGKIFVEEGTETDDDNRIFLDSEPHSGTSLEHTSNPELGNVVSCADPAPQVEHDQLMDDPEPTRRDDPLTLSQLSPRKSAGDDDVGNAQVLRDGAPSPMRPSVKRPSSAAADANAESGVRSKKRAASGGAPRVQSTNSAIARGSANGVRAVRGRGGARVVSVPAQVRKQPAQKACDAKSAQPAVPEGTRARSAAGATTNAGPKLRDNRNRVASAASVSGASSTLAGKNAGTRNTTAPVAGQFNFQVDGGAQVGESQGLGQGRAGTMARPKPYTIPDFKTMHASQAAQNALRRSQRAPTVSLPIAFSTDIRARERELFDDKVRAKERNLEAAREVERRAREEAEEKELRELRKRAVPKAHEVPDWYKEAPKRNHGAGQDQ
ncbi:hypothetical protein B0H19DRAFT_1137840 [Mycena capillaripes]|nr:hypothetical protein B0H19DRAFT_1137840 [Mycena capillaripes]